MTFLAARLPRFLPLVALGLALIAGAVSADELIESEPHIGDTLDHSPESIILTFDEPLLLEAGQNSVAIIGEDNVRLDDGKAQISAYSTRSLVVRPAPGVELEGEISIVYLVNFGSGAQASGDFAFAVEPGVPQPDDEVAPVGEPRSSESIVIWTIMILAGVALFSVLAYYLRYATDNARSSIADSDEAPH